MQTRELLIRRLELIHRWYQGMVGPDGMFEYLYFPERDRFSSDRSPIRAIATIWDVEVLEKALGREDLRPVTERSLRHYAGYLVETDGCLILDPVLLQEPSSIAHSAFMVLALLHASPPLAVDQIRGLADGIHRQQRADGSYQVYFHDLPDSGEELYAGEAMLALLEASRVLGPERYVDGVTRAFEFYDQRYFQRGRVADDMLVFFANWQSQACRLLFERVRGESLGHAVADYLYRMHDRIIERRFYEDVERYPERQVSVEVACALEGLNDAYAVARATNNERIERYRRSICTGLNYLLRVQRTEGGTERERGGFGMSLDYRAQRIDVTGHAASALLKSVDNGIECGPQ